MELMDRKLLDPLVGCLALPEFHMEVIYGRLGPGSSGG
jgi:hypothetical protein